MLYPVFIMILLTFATAFYLLNLRIRAVRAGAVSIGYYRTYTGTEPPPKLLQAANHYSNLFEMPLLFYITCLTTLLLQYQTAALLALAWLFVIARLVHSTIHLTYNNVLHRLMAFMVSNLCVLAMWVLIALHYAGR